MADLHAHLYAMDGSQAYLSRLAELEQEMLAAKHRSPEARANLRALYAQVRSNFCIRYPGYQPPATPLCFRHR